MLFRFDEFKLTIGDAIVTDQISGTAEIIGAGDYWEVGDIVIETWTNGRLSNTLLKNFDGAPPLCGVLRLQVIEQLDRDRVANMLADAYPARRELGYGHLQHERL